MLALMYSKYRQYFNAFNICCSISNSRIISNTLSLVLSIQYVSHHKVLLQTTSTEDTFAPANASLYRDARRLHSKTHRNILHSLSMCPAGFCQSFRIPAGFLQILFCKGTLLKRTRDCSPTQKQLSYCIMVERFDRIQASRTFHSTLILQRLYNKQTMNAND